jgi:FAD/FMN-containing dehydrogenase
MTAPVNTLTGSRPALVETIAGFDGMLLEPGDRGFEDARRVFNGMIDKVPAAIARCRSTADIAAALRFAVESELTIAVRGGGHSVAGHSVCDGGLVIDLSLMREVVVDPDARLARAQPGATWRDMDRAAGRFGLATPGGVVSSTGVAGFTLGGGLGWLSRPLGPACDNMIAAEVVLPSGQVVRASESDDAELLWGLRGGGGNFGVVGEFEFALHPVRRVVGGIASYEASEAESLVDNYRSVMDDAPDDLAAILDFASAPDGSGRPLVTVVSCSPQTEQSNKASVQQLLGIDHSAVAGDPVTQLVREFRYPVWQQVLDQTAPPGRLNYWKTTFMTDLSDDALQAICELGRSLPSPWTRVHVIRLGGVASRVPPGATAFSGRYDPYLVHLIAAWEDASDTERCVAWTNDAYERLRLFGAGRAYLNFIGDEGHDRVKASFGEETYRRLARLKARCDPDNVLALNQNVIPATGSAASGE